MSSFYFRQLLAGRDFAVAVPAARQMANFVYFVGDRDAGTALVIDPAYAVAELIELAAADGMTLVGALVTHYHPDHIGGNLMGVQIEGLPELQARQGMKVHAQRTEADWIRRATGLSTSDFELHDSGDVVSVGNVRVELIHTPGHTPGSQCFLTENRLIAGDTLFLQGCGRTDFPGGDPRAMYESLTQKLAKVPDEAVLYPGHKYAPAASAAMGATRRTNQVFRPRDAAEWLAMFG